MVQQHFRRLALLVAQRRPDDFQQRRIQLRQAARAQGLRRLALGPDHMDRQRQRRREQARRQAHGLQFLPRARLHIGLLQAAIRGALIAQPFHDLAIGLILLDDIAARDHRQQGLVALQLARQLVQLLHLTGRGGAGEPQHAVGAVGEALRERGVFRRDRMQAGGVQQHQAFAQAHTLNAGRGLGRALGQRPCRLLDAPAAQAKEMHAAAMGRKALGQQIAQRTLAGIELAEDQQHDLVLKGPGQRLCRRQPVPLLFPGAAAGSQRRIQLRALLRQRVARVQRRMALKPVGLHGLGQRAEPARHAAQGLAHILAERRNRLQRLDQLQLQAVVGLHAQSRDGAQRACAAKAWSAARSAWSASLSARASATRSAEAS